MNGATNVEKLVQRVMSGESLLLVGEAGVGKSHLATEVAQRLQALGWGRETVFGTPSIRPLRFGAIHHLIAESATRTPDELIAMADGHLRRLDQGHGSVLVVDDLDGIDSDSLAVVHQLAARGHRVVATVRSDAAAGPLVLPLWKDAVLERVDVLAEPSATASLIETFLHAPAASSLVEQVAALTLGNPLFIRELIADANTTGRLVERNGLYESIGPLTTAQRVTDLLETRFANLDPELHRALEMIAVCEPCDLRALSQVIGALTLDRLEAIGLIAARPQDDHDTVTVTHPLIAEVVRSSTPLLRRRKHQLALGAAVLEHASPRPIDLARAVTWLIDGGTLPHSAHVKAAARHSLATFDGETALKLLDAGQLTGEATTEIDLMLGRSFMLEGDVDSSVERLECALANASSDDERAEAAVALSEVLMFARGDQATARHVSTVALESVTEGQAKARILSSILLGAGMTGDFQPALTLGVQMSDEPELDERSRLSILIITTLAQAITGHTARLDADLRLAERIVSRHTAAFPAAREQLLIARAMQGVTDGSVVQTQTSVQKRLDEIGPNNAMSSILQQTMATTSMLSGRGDEARRFALLALRSDAADPLGLDVLAHALAARVLAATGDSEGSAAETEQCLASPRLGIRERAYLEEAAALRLARSGEIEAAVQRCVGGHARSGDNKLWAMVLLYQAVRFGAPEPVLSAMEAETQFHDTLICGTQIAHARALALGDADQLRVTTQQFASVGVHLYAAEASAHASWHEVKDLHQAARDAALAHTLFSRCDSLWSIALEQTEDPLTKREREICVEATAGGSTKGIADALGLSVRTVENHTQRAFKKLGIHNRADLTPIFS